MMDVPHQSSIDLYEPALHSFHSLALQPTSEFCDEMLHRFQPRLQEVITQQALFRHRFGVTRWQDFTCLPERAVMTAALIV